MKSKFLILLVCTFFILSCNKQKAAEFAGVYDCSCTHKIITPGSSNLSVNYMTSLEFNQSKAKLTVGDWTFPVRKLSQIDSFEEELEDGSFYSVDFDENFVKYDKSVPTEDGVSETKCSGPKAF